MPANLPNGNWHFIIIIQHNTHLIMCNCNKYVFKPRCPGMNHLHVYVHYCEEYVKWPLFVCANYLAALLWPRAEQTTRVICCCCWCLWLVRSVDNTRLESVWRKIESTRAVAVFVNAISLCLCERHTGECARARAACDVHVRVFKCRWTYH